MKHDAYLANDLFMQSMLAKIAKLEARVAALELKPRRSAKRRKAQRTTADLDHASFAIMRSICAGIAAEYHMDLTDLRGRETAAPRLVARAKAMSACMAAGISTPVIGRFFDGRDHSTVIHVVKAHGPKPKEGTYE